jgi:prepilin-type N-terminal cleavage/methylation domain-containing protein
MFSKLFPQEGGFTLVELLVTLAIMAGLFSIATIALNGVGASAQTDVCAAEYQVVESAIEIYMTENPGVSLTPGTDTTISHGDGEFADYLRGTTAGLYSWTSDGVLTAGTCPAPVPTQGGGCGSP